MSSAETWYLSADGTDEARQKGGFGDLTFLGIETTTAIRGPYLFHAIPNKEHLIVTFVMRMGSLETNTNAGRCGPMDANSK